MKHRFWVDSYKLFQLDQRDDKAVSAGIAKRVLELADEALPRIDIVVIFDYQARTAAGAFSYAAVTEAARGGKTGLWIRRFLRMQNDKLYRGNCIICLNLKEARSIDPGFEPSDDPAAFATLNRELDTDRLIVSWSRKARSSSMGAGSTGSGE